MSTLNFEIGSLSTSNTTLMIENKTIYNMSIVALEPILVVLGLYLLFAYPTNLVNEGFELSIVKVGGLISLASGIVVASSLHLECLIVDRQEKKVTIVERRWYRLISKKISYAFDYIVSVIVKSEYRESSLVYTLWLVLGDENKICLGNTSGDRIDEVVTTIRDALELEENQIIFK